MSKQRLEEITDAFAAGFQAGADAARRECAGIANEYFDSLSAGVWDEKYDPEATLESVILSRVGQPVKE